ncbi:MAG: VanZ family protein [Lacibacter sp.]
MKIPFKKYLTTKWPAILWSVFVFVLLAVPVSYFSREPKLTVSNLDKAVHFVLFFLLVTLWGFYFKQNFPGTYRKLLAIVVILSVIYGVAMEYIQLFTGRDFDVWDMAADAIGSFTGVLLVTVKNKPR